MKTYVYKPSTLDPELYPLLYEIRDIIRSSIPQHDCVYLAFYTKQYCCDDNVIYFLIRLYMYIYIFIYKTKICKSNNYTDLHLKLKTCTY